jgi:hypothetical protein
VKKADQVLQPYWTYKTHIAVPTLRKCFSMVGIFYIKNAHVHGEDIHAILHCIYFVIVNTEVNEVALISR